mmetsp:Transcript_35663/g.29976  ORF Transcript_35663/g.29976 Transcript_35663/m.29976 type:complete len:117 (-) Transcript_35663:95-445(-)
MNTFARDDLLANIGRVFLLVLVVLSYMFMIIPCKVAMSELLLGKNEVKLEPSYSEFVIITTALNTIAFVTAYYMKDLSLVISINGSFTGSLVGFICPAIFEIVIFKRKGIQLSISD